MIKLLQSERRRVFLGAIILFLACAGYGGGQTLAKVIVNGYASPVIGAAFATFFGTAFVGMIVHRDVASGIMKVPSRAWKLMSLAGLVSPVGLMCVFTAVQDTPVVIVSPLTAISPLFTIIVARSLLGGMERITRRRVIGTLLLIGGGVVVALNTAA